MNCDTCSICLEENVDYTTNCNHVFHKKCIDKWKHNNTCPYCRKELKKLNKFLCVKHKTFDLSGIGELIKKDVGYKSNCFKLKIINCNNNIVRNTHFFHDTVWDIESLPEI
jgi:superfamily II DNA helicase RecQ